jgi:hypothetical protein
VLLLDREGWFEPVGLVAQSSASNCETNLQPTI